jgi:hypothetical protein
MPLIAEAVDEDDVVWQVIVAIDNVAIDSQ